MASSGDSDSFEEDADPGAARAEAAGAPGIFVVDLDGFEGPLDVLLSLAREHKLDLTQISILALADQYLAFVAEARRRNLDIAAEYLVMAAWLAYLKSRLLLPDLGDEDEPTGEEMAAALAFQIKRLEAMQEAGAALMARPRLGEDLFSRGMPEAFKTETTAVVEVTLFDLLSAYAHQHRRSGGDRTLRIEPFEIYTVEDALKRLRKLFGGPDWGGLDWTSLWRFLPEDLRSGLMHRSAVASTFVASLELAKEGQVTLRQDGTYGPLYVRGVDDKNAKKAGSGDGA